MEVDLLEYGAKEISMHVNGEASWVFEMNLEDENKRFKNICTSQILNIYPAASPADWRIDWEDMYVSSGLARSFWRMVEKEDDEDDEDDDQNSEKEEEEPEEDYVMQIPGSWSE